jgi:hypothetical protein
MYKFLVLLHFIFLFDDFFYSQKLKLISLNFNQNIDIWKPYSVANDHNQMTFQRKSKTFTGSVLYTAINKPNFAVKAGIALKSINYIVYNRITTYSNTEINTIVVPPFYDTVTHTENIPTDFFSKSLNLGIQFSIEKKINFKRPMFVGILLEAYPIEFFKAYYENVDTYGFNDPEPSILYVKFGDENAFTRTKRFANTNFSMFYAYNIINKRYVSIALKLSAGANLYSDWNQFSKYAWLGLGFEVGFGQFKKDKNSGSDAPL